MSVNFQLLNFLEFDISIQNEYTHLAEQNNFTVGVLYKNNGNNYICFLGKSIQNKNANNQKKVKTKVCKLVQTSARLFGSGGG